MWTASAGDILPVRSSLICICTQPGICAGGICCGILGYHIRASGGSTAESRVYCGTLQPLVLLMKLCCAQNPTLLSWLAGWRCCFPKQRLAFVGDSHTRAQHLVLCIGWQATGCLKGGEADYTLDIALLPDFASICATLCTTIIPIKCKSPLGLDRQKKSKETSIQQL